jgi:hypothetical protein
MYKVLLRNIRGSASRVHSPISIQYWKEYKIQVSRNPFKRAFLMKMTADDRQGIEDFRLLCYNAV